MGKCHSTGVQVILEIRLADLHAPLIQPMDNIAPYFGNLQMFVLELIQLLVLIPLLTQVEILSLGKLDLQGEFLLI